MYKMRIGTFLTYLFVGVYAVACFVLIYVEMNGNSKMMDENYWFSEQMVSDAKMVQEAECIWLIQTLDSAKYCVVDGFAEAERMIIDGTKLGEILNTHFYIDQNENVVRGQFYPLVVISYHVNETQITIVYSFMNAEARLFANGEFVKSVVIYDANVLEEIFEDI